MVNRNLQYSKIYISLLWLWMKRKNSSYLNKLNHFIKIIKMPSLASLTSSLGWRVWVNLVSFSGSEGSEELFRLSHNFAFWPFPSVLLVKSFSSFHIPQSLFHIGVLWSQRQNKIWITWFFHIWVLFLRLFFLYSEEFC